MGNPSKDSKLGHIGLVINESNIITAVGKLLTEPSKLSNKPINK